MKYFVIILTIFIPLFVNAKISRNVAKLLDNKMISEAFDECAKLKSKHSIDSYTAVGDSALKLAQQQNEKSVISKYFDIAKKSFQLANDSLKYKSTQKLENRVIADFYLQNGDLEKAARFYLNSGDTTKWKNICYTQAVDVLSRGAFLGGYNNLRKIGYSKAESIDTLFVYAEKYGQYTDLGEYLIKSLREKSIAAKAFYLAAQNDSSLASLYERAGNLYLATGDTLNANDAYLNAAINYLKYEQSTYQNANINMVRRYQGLIKLQEFGTSRDMIFETCISSKDSITLALFSLIVEKDKMKAQKYLLPLITPYYKEVENACEGIKRANEYVFDIRLNESVQAFENLGDIYYKANFVDESQKCYLRAATNLYVFALNNYNKNIERLDSAQSRYLNKMSNIAVGSGSEVMNLEDEAQKETERIEYATNLTRMNLDQIMKDYQRAISLFEKAKSSTIVSQLVKTKIIKIDLEAVTLYEDLNTSI